MTNINVCQTSNDRHKNAMAPIALNLWLVLCSHRPGPKIGCRLFPTLPGESQSVCPFFTVRLAFPCSCVICHSSLSLPLLLRLPTLLDFLPRDCYCYMVKNRPAHIVDFIFPGLLFYSVIFLHHSYFIIHIYPTLRVGKLWPAGQPPVFINKALWAHRHAHWLQIQNWVVELWQGLRMAPRV